MHTICIYLHTSYILKGDFSPFISTRRLCFGCLLVWSSMFKITLGGYDGAAVGGPWWQSGNTLTSHL